MRVYLFSWLTLLSLSFAISPAFSIEPTEVDQQITGQTEEILSDGQSKRLDQSVDKALAWLAQQQQQDGRFPGPPTGQPGITSLTIMAFLSAGHLPDAGPYSDHLKRAINFALSCETEKGLFSESTPRAPWVLNQASHTATYNQAITALMFAEVSGELKGQLGEDVAAAVNRAIIYTDKIQFRTLPKRKQDEGGWRYVFPCREDKCLTDLSITAWQVTFLRSAKNAGFDVKTEMVEAAQKYVKSLFNDEKGTFTYDHRRTSRGMTGAGMMAMAMLGQHQTQEVKAAAKWLQEHPFDSYGKRSGFLDRFHYSVYYCTQGAYQLGGKQWQEFYPNMVDLLTHNQNPNGSWQALSHEIPFGNTYTTAMSVLSLTPTYALLPIHQR